MSITVFLPLLLYFGVSWGYAPGREVVTSSSTTCTTYDGVKCWGHGAHGVLGTGSSSSERSPPSDPIDLGSDFVATKTSCARTHCCSLSTGHSVKCWGQWEGAGYRHGKTIDSEAEMGNALPAHWSGGGIHDIMVLDHMSCVLKWPGNVYCFGKNTQNVFTNWNGFKKASKAVKMDLDFKVATLGGGYYTLCVATESGRVTCEGGASYHDLQVTNRDVGGAVESVACGKEHCCALTVSKTLDCWGSNEIAQPYNLGSGFHIQDIGVGIRATCVVSTAGAVKCFGTNLYRQTSANGQIKAAFAPYDVGISSGGYANHFCVYDKWRPLMQCWGDNRDGQLGYGNTNKKGRSYKKGMPLVDVGALCKPYLTGFPHWSFDGRWTVVPGVTKNGAPVYQKPYFWLTRYLWKWDEHKWGIGTDYNRNTFYMYREQGPNLFDPCEGSTCYRWKYNKNGKWKTTDGSEKISCFSIDASASMAGSEFTEEGEMEEAPPPDESEAGPGDFMPMLAGAAVGALLVAVIVAVVVTVRKKKAAKSTELEMTEAVHVPDVSVMTGGDKVVEDSSHAPAVTVSVSMDTLETMINAEMKKETEAEVEVVTATEMEAGSRNEC